MPSKFCLKNPHLGKNDHLYHLGILAADDLEKRFGDIQFICMGGKSSRMREFAEYLYENFGRPENSDFQSSLADDGRKRLRNVSESAGRYSMYKVGNVLLLSHGIGMASLSVVLNELFKLLHYARCQHDVKIIRIGTSGGLGVAPGTLVITDQPYNSRLRPEFLHVSLGRKFRNPCSTCPQMRQELLESSRTLKIPAVIANTMSTDDFFEEQCRLDGAFCDYQEADKMRFLTRAHDEYGIKNMEMESTCLSAMCKKADISCAIVCVTFLDRLHGDTVEDNPIDFKKWQQQLYKVVGSYMANSNRRNGA